MNKCSRELARTRSSADFATTPAGQVETSQRGGVCVSVAWTAATSVLAESELATVGSGSKSTAASSSPAWDIGLTVHTGDTPVIVETSSPAVAPWCAGDLSVVAPEAVPVVGGGVATENTSRLLKLLHSRVRPRCCANSIVNSVILNFMLLSCVHCV